MKIESLAGAISPRVKTGDGDGELFMDFDRLASIKQKSVKSRKVFYLETKSDKYFHNNYALIKQKELPKHILASELKYWHVHLGACIITNSISGQGSG